MAKPAEGQDLRHQDEGDNGQHDHEDQDEQRDPRERREHRRRDPDGQEDQVAGGRPPDLPAPRAGRSGRAIPPVERVQTGVRMEKRLVKVLKALAELYDLSLGDLLEGIVLHAFEGRSPFSASSLHRIAELERIYGLDLEPGAGARPLEAVEHQAAAP